ncbi:MAG TPA: Uma2 family endonuclease [Blastocatellia bacterium]|nr:Uma2 family endonuclease [Blastocatellia bacterium]
MSYTPRQTDQSPIVIHFSPVLKKITDADFYELCRVNPELRIEQTGDGDVIIMPPAGGETGKQNFSLTVQFGAWARTDGTGIGFDSSTAFALPNGAKRSPDLAWVKMSRWDSLTEKQRRLFPPLCPDFVVELRSESDSLADLQAKMREYIENGASLGWLIDPGDRSVYIYQPDAPMKCLRDCASVSGDPILQGFVLNLTELW